MTLFVAALLLAGAILIVALASRGAGQWIVLVPAGILAIRLVLDFSWQPRGASDPGNWNEGWLNIFSGVKFRRLRSIARGQTHPQT